MSWKSLFYSSLFLVLFFVAILVCIQLFYSSPFELNSENSRYKLKLKNTALKTSSILGIGTSKHKVNFESVMFGDRKSGGAGYFLNDKNGVQFLLEAKNASKATDIVTSKSSSGEAVVTYKNVKKDTDIVYKISDNQIKEEIVLRSKEALELDVRQSDQDSRIAYSFTLKTQGLSYGIDNNDEVIPVFTSVKDTTTYYLPQAYMVDGKGNKSYGVETIIKEDKNTPGNLIVTIIPNISWLTSPDRQFPIIIDPTLVKGESPQLSLNFDEGYGVSTYDGSTNSYDGAITAATWADNSFCISGRCLRFDGANDYVTFADHPNLDVADSTNMTVGAWVKLNNVTSSQTILSKKTSTDATDAGYILSYNSTTNIFEFRVSDGTDQFIINSKPVSDISRWLHIVAVFDETSSANSQIYINGQESKVSTSGNIANVNSLENSIDFIIGTQANGSADLDGFVDLVRMYKYARTSLQIKQDFLSKGSVVGASVHMGSDTNRKLSDGLVGYWRMDENSWNGTTGEVKDASGVGNHGTASGATITFGKFGAGGMFNGSTNYVSVPNDDSLNISDSVSISTWVKPASMADNGAPVYRVIAAKYNTNFTTNSSYWLIYHESQRQFVFGLGNGTTAIATYSNSYEPDNAWHFLVGTYDGKNARMYMDGELIDTSVYMEGPMYTSANNLYIGDDAGDRPFNGIIDELRIYNRALSEGEVKNLYYFAPGPVAHFDLNENSGTSTVYDKSGNGLMGTMIGSMVVNNWVAGKYGSALSFDGSDDAVAANTVATSYYNDNSGTMCAWIKDASDSSNLYYLLGYGNSGSDATLAITKNYGNYQLRKNDGTIGLSSFTTQNFTNWTHVCLTWDGVNISKYENGIYTGSIADSTISTNTFTIGGNSSWGALGLNSKSIIDDVRIYNYPRTSSQIVEDMNAGRPITTTSSDSTLGYWKFDEGVGDTAFDSSSSSQNGDLAGSSVTCPGNTSCPTWSNSGKYGKALSFSSSGQYVGITTPTNIDTDQASEGTISFWMKPTFASSDTSSTRYIFGTSSGTNTHLGLLYCGNDYACTSWDWGAAPTPSAGSLVFIVLANGYWQTVYTIPPTSYSWSANEWTHVLISWDDTLAINDVKILLNAKETEYSHFREGSLNFSDITMPTTFYFGTLMPGIPGNLGFSGIIDELKIYPIRLTSQQIDIDHNSGKSLVLGALSTESDGKTPSWGTDRSFCVPGDTSSCSPPVAWWKMDENTSNVINDSSGNNLQGTVIGGASWGSGKFGSAINLTATNDYISIPDPGTDSVLDFASGQTMTIETWIKPLTLPTTGNYEVILTKNGNNGTDNFNYVLELGNNGYNDFFDICWQQSGTYSCYEVQSDVIQTGVWQHLAVVVPFGSASNSTVKAYHNAQLQNVNCGTGTCNINPDMANDDLWIGAANWDGGGIDQESDIIVDDVKIYNYARTPAQIAWTYSKGAPVAWYKFDECSGSVVNDWGHNPNSGFAGNNGTISLGSLGITNEGSCSTNASSSWYLGREGKNNSSLNLDGNDDQIIIPDSNIISFGNTTRDTPFSISAWVNADDMTDFYIFSKGSSTEAEYALYVDSGDRIEFDIFEDTSSIYIGKETASTLTTYEGIWKHIVATYDGSSSRTGINIYVDGVMQDLSNQGNGTITAMNNQWTDAVIGRNFTNGSTYADGKIDDVRIYNYVLTASQIKQVYNNGAVSFR